MKINLDAWEKLPTQKQVYEEDAHSIIMQSAGLGSGKTHVLCRKLLKLSALNRNFPGAVLAPTYKDFRRDIKPEMFNILEDDLNLKIGKHFDFSKTSSEFKFCWTNKPLYVLTAEKPIAGPNLAYCGINEFSLIQYERIKEMLRRVRLKDATHKQSIMVGTPEDVHGWLEEFVELQKAQEEKKPNTFKIFFADTAENKFIDPDYRQHLETMLDAQALKVFASGQIVRISGSYYYYAFDTNKNVAPVKYNEKEIIHVGLDFNVGQMAAHFGHIYGSGDKKEYRVFDELLLTGEANTPAMAEAIQNRYPKEKILITCDSAGKNRKTTGKSDVFVLRNKGFNVRFRAANPKHRQRQLLVNGLLDHKKIIIDPSCKNMIRDLSKVQQRKEDFSKEKDKDDKLTHFSDGLDYVIDFEFELRDRASKNATIQL